MYTDTRMTRVYLYRLRKINSIRLYLVITIWNRTRGPNYSKSVHSEKIREMFQPFCTENNRQQSVCFRCNQQRGHIILCYIAQEHFFNCIRALNTSTIETYILNFFMWVGIQYMCICIYIFSCIYF